MLSRARMFAVASAMGLFAGLGRAAARAVKSPLGKPMALFGGVGRMVVKGRMLVVTLLLGVFGGIAAAVPPTIDLTFPDIVDWAQVVTATVAFIGAGIVVIYGMILGFRFVKRMILRLSSAI